MNDALFLELLMRWQDGVLPPHEHAALEGAMRDDPVKRQLFAETQVRSLALQERFRQEAFRVEAAPQTRAAWHTRPFTAMAAGLVLGLFCASMVWAMSSPRVTRERLFELVNGSFEEARLERGFPQTTGLWSGDEATIRDGQLHFVAPGSDSGDPSGRAVSCDVFQLVDLRPLRHARSLDSDSVLELSASFADARPANSPPSITFFCQLYLFQGDPSILQPRWPQNLFEALASGSAQVTTLGRDVPPSRTITAKCLVPPEADFAVIQIAARPNLRPAKLENVFADDVKLTLRTQPSLPVRVVQR